MQSEKWDADCEEGVAGGSVSVISPFSGVTPSGTLKLSTKASALSSVPEDDLTCQIRRDT
jgi:hypothetical protein